MLLLSLALPATASGSCPTSVVSGISMEVAFRPAADLQVAKQSVRTIPHSNQVVVLWNGMLVYSRRNYYRRQHTITISRFRFGYSRSNASVEINLPQPEPVRESRRVIGRRTDERPDTM